jgi:hypothetical protein
LAGRNWIFPHWGQNAAAFVGVWQLQQMVVETVADLGAFIGDGNLESVLTADQMRRKSRGRKSPPLKKEGGAPSAFL